MEQFSLEKCEGAENTFFLMALNTNTYLSCSGNGCADTMHDAKQLKANKKGEATFAAIQIQPCQSATPSF